MIWAILAATVVLTWTPPTTNEDGTPLTDLAGYRLYYSEASPVVKDPANKLVELDSSICTSQDKTFHFAVTAFDTSGNESKLSNEVSATVSINECTYIVDFSKLEVK